jgi:hypothetical protein
VNAKASPRVAVIAILGLRVISVYKYTKIYKNSANTEVFVLQV